MQSCKVNIIYIYNLKRPYGIPSPAQTRQVGRAGILTICVYSAGMTSPATGSFA